MTTGDVRLYESVTDNWSYYSETPGEGGGVEVGGLRYNKEEGSRTV